MIYAAPGTPVPSSPSSLATATTSAASSCLRSGPVLHQHLAGERPADRRVPRSTAEDIDKALDAAHAAADAWGRTSVQERSNILLKIADRIEQNLELLAVTETWDNGKAVRETLNADIPWPPTTSATSPAASAPRKAPPPRSTTAPWPTTSTSPWA